MMRAVITRLCAGGRDEKSNSFALFVITLPVILGAFGIGVDMTRNTYLRTSIQNHLDMATVAGASVMSGSVGGKIDAKKAVAEVEKVYAVNRWAGPGLSCTGTGKRVPGTEAPRCWTQPKKPTVSTRSVTYTVGEQSTNAFLVVLGVPKQSYYIQSTAVVNQATQ